MTPRLPPQPPGTLRKRTVTDPHNLGSGQRSNGVDSADKLFQMLKALDWGFDGAATGTGGHDVHPYPAKFPPQLPAQLIESLTDPGSLILDPFGGSGTTALEAVRLGRSAISVDANPVAVRLCRIKGAGVDHETRRRLDAIIEHVQGAKLSWIAHRKECPNISLCPTIPNIDKWYSPISVHELCDLRALASAYTGLTRDIIELAIGQTASRLSFQESETRYVSKPREIHDGAVFEQFTKELERLRTRAPEAQWSSASTSLMGDARQRQAVPLPDGSVDAVITSPPYPNSYDYHLYHRFRLLWTESDPGVLRRIEIGSHLRQQALVDPIADYENDMTSVLTNLFALLRPGGWCVFVVGNGVYKGIEYSTSETIARIGQAVGFNHAGTIERSLPTHKRSVTSAGRRLKVEQMVVLRSPNNVLHSPNWAMAPYEQILGERELHALKSIEPKRYAHQLTFVKAVSTDENSTFTVQGLLERGPGGRTKNSTYGSHGIHRYKGKFYPQLGRALINLCSQPKQLIMDPFCGSGTVALESAMLSRDFHGIELSPVGSAVTKAKLASLALRQRNFSAADAILLNMQNPRGDAIDWDQFNNQTRQELESWFAPRVLAKLSGILRTIADLENVADSGPALNLIAKVCLSDIVRDISNQDPKDLRIRRRAAPLTDAPVIEMFLTRWTNARDKILAANSIVDASGGNATVRNGSCLEEANWPIAVLDRRIDSIVTSPPYASALPYIDTDRLSIAAVFGVDKQVRAGLESTLVGSREIRGTDLKAQNAKIRAELFEQRMPDSTLTFLHALLEQVEKDDKAGFRRRQTPAVLARYFTAMSRVFELAAAQLRDRGQFWMVIGDSKTTVNGTTWKIPTTNEMIALGKMHGLNHVESLPITVTRQNMRHSKNAITDNTLLHFEKP